MNLVTGESSTALRSFQLILSLNVCTTWHAYGNMRVSVDFQAGNWGLALTDGRRDIIKVSDSVLLTNQESAINHSRMIHEWLNPF